MEITIIFIILASAGLLLWRSYVNNKDPENGKNPNPNAPTSSSKL
jgi:hypothetical protein